MTTMSFLANFFYIYLKSYPLYDVFSQEIFFILTNKAQSAGVTKIRNISDAVGKVREKFTPT